MLIRWHNEQGFLRCPQAADLEDVAGADPAERPPIVGGGYMAIRKRNGKADILGVPVMLELPAGARWNKKPIDKDWFEAAILKSKAREAENGYLAPIHVDHHGFLNSDASGAGFMRPTHCAQVMYEGQKKWAMFADFLNVKPGVYQKIKELELPYRSVEVLDWEKPEVNSCALMEHHVPFFRMAMLTVGDEIEETERLGGVTMSDEAAAKFEAAAASVAREAREGFFSLSALGHPNGARMLQKFEGYGKVKEEKDEDGKPADKDGADDETGTEEEVEPTGSCCPHCDEILAKLDDQAKTLERIEGYMDGSLTPEVEKKPAEAPPADPDKDSDKEKQEKPKMSAELLKKLQERAEAQDAKIAKLEGDQQRSAIKVNIAEKLAGRKVPADLRKKLDEAIAGADLAAAAIRVDALLDGFLSAPVKSEAESTEVEADPAPDATLEAMDHGAPSKRTKDLPKEVLEFQSQGAAKFDKAVDLYKSWKVGRSHGAVKSSLKDFLAINMQAKFKLTTAKQDAAAEDKLDPGDDDAKE